MSRTLCAAAAAVVLAALVAGCGDDESTTASPETTGVTGFTGEAPADGLEYHLIADEYCREAENELDRAAREQFGGGEPSPDELEEFVAEVYLPVMRRQLAQLRTIPIPPGEEEAINEIYDALEEGLDQAEADPGALADGPPPGIVEASRLAVEYGFDDCGLDT